MFSGSLQSNASFDFGLSSTLDASGFTSAQLQTNFIPNSSGEQSCGILDSTLGTNDQFKLNSGESDVTDMETTLDQAGGDKNSYPAIDKHVMDAVQVLQKQDPGCKVEILEPKVNIEDIISSMPGNSFKITKLENGDILIDPIVKPMDENVWLLDNAKEDSNEAEKVLTKAYNQFALDVSNHIKNLPTTFFDKSPEKKAFYKTAQGTMKNSNFKQDFYRTKNRKA